MMSPVAQLSLLALAATSVLAVPRAQHHAHSHLHSSGRVSSPSVYGTGNATKPRASGTGFHSGASSASKVSTTAPAYGGKQTSYTTMYVTVTAGATDVAAVNNAADTDCSSETTVTSTQKSTIYVTATQSYGSDVSAVVESTTTISGKTSTVHSTIYSTRRSHHSSPSAAPSIPSSYSSKSTVSSSATSSALVSPVTLSSSTSTSTSTSTSSSSSSSSSPAYIPPAYTPPTSSSEAAPETTSESSTYVAPTTTSTSSTPVYTPPAYSSTSSSSSAWIPAVVSSVVNNIIPSSTSSTAAAASATSGTTGVGKRGVAYNNAALTSAFVGYSQISWGYNWASATSGLNSQFNYIPLLWGLAEEFTGAWLKNAKSAISGGAGYVFSFNEPDLASQSNISPSAAAAAWKLFMEPLAGAGAKLCAPSVTNGGGATGLAWLQSFLDACDGCTIDCLNIHWYDSASNTAYFKSHVQQALAMAGGSKPLFITEFGASGSDDQISDFLQEVMPWMDGQDQIHGYAYYMVDHGSLISASSTNVSTYGATYRNYVG